jgi:transcriptional regulator with XRE-family HTH domain
MLDPKRIGEFIAKLRKDKDLTQSALADMLFVTHQAVSKWENGIALPDLEVLVAMRKLFGVSVDNILDGGLAGHINPVNTEGISSAASEDEIIVYDSQVFDSQVSATKCTIMGEAYFSCDVNADILDVVGKGTFKETVRADRFIITGNAILQKELHADDLAIRGMFSSSSCVFSDNLDSSGMSTIGGEVKSDSFKNTGMLTIGGGVTTDSFYNSGMLTLGGEVVSDSFENSGMVTIGDQITTDSISNQGALSIGSTLTADIADLAGSFNIGDRITADRITITLSDTDCSAGSIKADTIYITNSIGVAGRFLKVRTIEADQAELVNVKVSLVNIKNGTIGSGCHIERLECGEDVKIDTASCIAEIVRI